MTFKTPAASSHRLRSRRAAAVTTGTLRRPAAADWTELRRTRGGSLTRERRRTPRCVQSVTENLLRVTSACRKY